MKKLIIGISGASGVIYGIRMLQILQNINEIETHLVISEAAYKTLSLESDYNIVDLQNFANVTYNVNDIAASISSGSFKTEGMVIIPCSMKTLSGIVHSYSDSLLTRAADVILKEKRKLVLCIRETPLHIGHLRMMTLAAELGAVIMPIVPAFYHRPKTIQAIIDQTINRVHDQFNFNLPKDLFNRWV
ncbi:UbiX family flavin prenyltransferase [Candidatus Ishikawella capsulata]|uniref:Flavin prenyltransferase UbiX n=1 Tax=Candidatus Ishikawaella capsulata Mpkobe TaxID=476281 RepID=C5WC55_9ENTR|nr:UbiX family flavin prenyltransferase [Candidatus Ishikawaella capsulata]BAH82911.1 3-octaprenyl-4-hydroxybenzoate carboxy-lyase [Candidatus Ishikawaella capsulata Mpkobe]